jgi:ferredoxin-nitrate reductase
MLPILMCAMGTWCGWSLGEVEVAVRCTGNRPGTVFLPFHYGDPETAANDLTPTSWDPVSKQPHFKSGAVRVVPTENGKRGGN